MPLSTRKQRELQQREQLMMDTAQMMLSEDGFPALTMDKLAERVEYSKGTVYNHFTSKEDILCSLCCRSVNNLIALFEKAYAIDGTPRERYSAIGIAYSTYHQTHPLDCQNIQIIKNDILRDKISEQRLQELERSEQRITEIGISIIREAISAGDLPDDTDAESLFFGCWSMHHGALIIDQSEIPLDELGFNPVIEMLWNNSQRFLDGFGWKPLSSETDNLALFKKLSSALFEEE